MVRWPLVALLVFILGCVALASPRTSTGMVSAATSSPAYTISEPDLFIYVPTNATQFQPLQVLVAIHGMGGNGSAFCQDLLATAEQNSWIVVAPTFRYQDYRNPALVLQDDLTFLPRIAAILDGLPARLNLQTRQKVLLYGHSRGGQMVHRFATLYPERTLAVAAIAAGSYTLPLATMLANGRSQTLPMPYGVADMPARVGRAFDYQTFKRIPFRIEVGAADTNPDDAPRAWDSYLGVTRVDRARAYAKTLSDLGMAVTLGVYPGAGHGVTQAMHDDALAFLAGIVPARARQFGHGLGDGLAAYQSSTSAAASVSH